MRSLLIQVVRHLIAARIADKQRMVLRERPLALAES